MSAQRRVHPGLIGLLALMLTGCGVSVSGLFGPTRTPEIIYITATFLPVTPSAIPSTPTNVPSWTPLPTATALPPTSAPPTLTPTFTPLPSETPTPKAATLVVQQTRTARAALTGKTG